jgi:hypothetical protein
LRADEGRGDVLEIERSQGGELLVDPLEDVVVEVPGLYWIGAECGFWWSGVGGEREEKREVSWKRK